MERRSFKLKKRLFSVLIIFVSLWFIACKSTDTAAQTDNTAQEEIQAPEEETEVAALEEIQSIEEAAPEEQDVTIVEEEPRELTVEEQRALKMATLTREQGLFYGIKYTYDYEVVGCDLDYKIMVNDEKKEVIIQFEETDSDEDWHNNYLIFPWPLKLDDKVVWTTYGYAKIYKSSLNIPFNQFYGKVMAHPDYKVVIRGWSLGSAMAKIVARHFVIRTGKEKMIDELTTYGDVKCWYNLFYSVKKNCVRIREYVNSNDMITWCMPFCRRDVKCRVGDRFNLGKLKNSEYYHTHYEECDFSKWGDVSPEGEPIDPPSQKKKNQKQQ